MATAAGYVKAITSCCCASPGPWEAARRFPASVCGCYCPAVLTLRCDAEVAGIGGNPCLGDEGIEPFYE